MRQPKRCVRWNGKLVTAAYASVECIPWPALLFRGTVRRPIRFTTRNILSHHSTGRSPVVRQEALNCAMGEAHALRRHEQLGPRAVSLPRDGEEHRLHEVRRGRRRDLLRWKEGRSNERSGRWGSTEEASRRESN